MKMRLPWKRRPGGKGCGSRAGVGRSKGEREGRRKGGDEMREWKRERTAKRKGMEREECGKHGKGSERDEGGMGEVGERWGRG